jgi:hypothetical protein
MLKSNGYSGHYAGGLGDINQSALNECTYLGLYPANVMISPESMGIVSRGLSHCWLIPSRFKRIIF